MKTILILLIILLPNILFSTKSYVPENYVKYNSSTFTITQDTLDGNNIRSFIWNTGIFDQNYLVINFAGCEWPKGSGKYLMYSAGLTLSAYINGAIRLAVAAYKGEYSPGYCVNSAYLTNPNFRFYKIKRGNGPSTPDWANWGLMVPYGAPYIDVNHNGTYDAAVDTPGVRSAAQCIFICLTDADSNSHSPVEGFSGGTKPLGAEVHLTAWCYDNPGYQDMQFFKWVVINKSTNLWDSTNFSFTTDPDLGDFTDDVIGSDSALGMGYTYNYSDMDGDGGGLTYGLHPPAVGLVMLNCGSQSSAMSSFNYYTCVACPGPVCESDPSVPIDAFQFLTGKKKDGTPYVVPNTNPPLITKYCYSGDPQTNAGWTSYIGKVGNCGGSLTGNLLNITGGDVRMLLNSRRIGLRMNPGDTQVVQICQLVARGTNNLNSVTLLKQKAQDARNLCQNGFVIGITPISTEVPNNFALYQNYPNPFNPTTKIRFDIPPSKGDRGMMTQIKIYDALGREVATLVNEQLKPGTYETEWPAPSGDGTNFPSGVYFYRLETQDYTQTKKMVLIK